MSEQSFNKLERHYQSPDAPPPLKPPPPLKLSLLLPLPPPKPPPLVYWPIPPERLNNHGMTILKIKAITPANIAKPKVPAINQKITPIIIAVAPALKNLPN